MAANVTAGAGDLAGSSTSGTAPATISNPANLVNWDFIILTAQVIISAMGIIWLGANSSLRRPPSAAPAKRDSKKRSKPEEKLAEGFVASDAIVFPLLAGTVLIGLYYLIKWLKDPDMLNKLLRGYMSSISIVSLGKLCADALHLLTSVIFPTIWSDRTGTVFKVDSSRRRQLVLGGGAGDAVETVAEGKKTPFPGYLSNMSFSSKAIDTFWEIRHLLGEEWLVRLAMHGLGAGRFHVHLNDLVGVVLAILITATYFLTGWFWLSNILGTAFSYAAFTLMSPTSFTIGTMVLAGLFVYDIVMVFYTPYMITVATKLDVPIKLVFQGPSRSSMLGLGDIVIPGIFIGLALRFDLWQYYQKQVKYVPTKLESELGDEVSGETKIVSQTQHRAVKVPFIDPQGRWGDRFWTTSWRRIFAVPTATPDLAATAFPKTYFFAAMAGYAAGMLLTLTMLLVFSHGQPALLYLVPCVTGAVWLTGAVRGELHSLWTYTEDGTLDTEDVVVELVAQGNVITPVKETREAKSDTQDVGRAGSKAAEAPGSGIAGVQQDQTREGPGDDAAQNAGESYDVFLFSITAPRQGASEQEK